MGRSSRADQFHHSTVNIVHTVQRCVRRAFLAGVDSLSGNDYSFRREWIRRRLEALASVFGVDVLSYSILSNHFHLILRNRPDVVATWSDREVAIRWLRVYPGKRIEEHLGEPTDRDVDQLVHSPERVQEIRTRLSDISWFMKSLSEPIARMANRQDECTGRFWEGRFKATKLIDEAGLLACAMYVDMNPVRAAMAELPEQAEHTSAYDRMRGEQGETIDSAAFDLVPVNAEQTAEETRQMPIEDLKRKRKSDRRNPTGRQIRRDDWLAPLTLSAETLSLDPEAHTDGFRASDKGFLNLTWPDYLTLLRWTAAEKFGAASQLPEKLAEILAKLGIDAGMWRDLVWNFKRYFGQSSCVGTPGAMASDADRLGRRWHRGQAAARCCFTTTAA